MPHGNLYPTSLLVAQHSTFLKFPFAHGCCCCCCCRRRRRLVSFRSTESDNILRTIFSFSLSASFSFGVYINCIQSVCCLSRGSAARTVSSRHESSYQFISKHNRLDSARLSSTHSTRLDFFFLIFKGLLFLPFLLLFFLPTLQARIDFFLCQ